MKQGGTVMKKPRTFKVELTYNEIMVLITAIDEFNINKDVSGVDTLTDMECKALKTVKTKILDAYIKGNQ